MTTKRPMTMAEHRRVAAALMSFHDELQNLFVGVVQFTRTQQRQRPWLKLLNQIDEVRCTMDDQLCREHPIDYQTRIYYPGKAVKS